MMPSKNGQLLYSFLIILTQCHKFPGPKLTNSHILHHVFPYLTAYLKINYEKGHTERRTGKTQRCIQA